MIILNKKRILSAATAALCFAGTFAVMPEIAGMQTVKAQAVFDTFESNYDGWHGNADAVTLTAENGTGFENSRGMKVSNRSVPSDGAASSKGFYIWG